MLSVEDTGEDIYRIISRSLPTDESKTPNGDKETSTLLRGAGVSGIKYLDGSSRGAGEGSYNYVVFDDAAVKIVKTFYQSGQNDWYFGSKAWNEHYKDSIGRKVVGRAGDKPKRLTKAQMESQMEGNDYEMNLHLKAEAEEYAAFERMMDTVAKPRGWFTQNPDGSYTIGKTPTGDFSTFIHEPAHLYLTMFERLSQREGASERMRTDAAKVLEYLEGDSFQNLSTEQVEKFARSFETYVREGKTPSEGLRGAFQRFKVWMTAIYQKAMELDVTIDDNIRGVFDRMIATDEEIALAHQEIAGPQLFKSAEEAGWTEKQFRDHAMAQSISEDQAREEILAKLNAAAVREKTVEYQTEKREVRAAVEAMVDDLPGFKAIRQLRKGALDDGTEFKLDRGELVRQFGEDAVIELQKAHPGLYRKEGGMDAEAAAEILGFASGQELLDTLLSTGKRGEAIDAETLRVMTERHGDIRYDGTLQDQAKLALINEERAKGLHRELTALRNKAIQSPVDAKIAELKAQIAQFEVQGKEQAGDVKFLETQANALLDKNEKLGSKVEARDAKIAELKAQIQEAEQEAKAAARNNKADARAAMVLPPIQSFREAARAMVETPSIKDLDPNRYLNGMRKYSREAYRLMGKDDYQGAADAKQKELLNHFLYLEAVKGKAEAQKIARYAGGLEKAPAQQRIGMAGSSYLDQVNALLDRFSFRKETNKSIEARQATLAEWATTQNPENLAIDPAIFNETYRKNYREMNLVELRAVNDALKNIEALARNDSKVLDGESKADFNAAVAEMDGVARRNLKANPLPVDPNARTKAEKVGTWAKWMNTGIAKMERVVDHLDGGDINGPWRRMIFEPLANAQYKEYELTQKVTNLLSEAMEAMPKEQRHSMLDILDIPGIGRVTRKFVLSMAMNWGNASNREKMMEGMGWAGDVMGESPVDRAFKHLNRADWEFVQKTWDTLESLWPEIADLEKRCKGVEPPKIDRSPFEMALKDGSSIHLDGGYYPIVYDRSKSNAGANQAEADIMTPEGSFRNVGTATGHTKERVDFAAPLVLDFEAVLSRHIPRVIKDISHREAAQSVSRIIKNQTVRDAISETMGSEYMEMLLPWLRGTVNDTGLMPADVKGWQSMLMGLRSNMVLAGLSFRAGSIVVQATDLVRALTRIKARHLGQALLSYGSHPIELTREVRALSSEMLARSENLDRDVRSMMKRLQGKDGWFANVQKLGMEGLAIADTITSVTTWKGAYEQAISEGKPQPRAIKEADRTVRLTMMSSAPKDQVALQRVGDIGTKFLTMYMGDATSTYGIMNEQVRNIGAGKEIGKSLFRMAMVGIVLNLLGDVIKGRGPQDDEDKAWWMAKKAAFSPWSSIPIARDIAQSLESGMDYKFTPVANAIDKAVKTVRMGGKLFDPDATVEWDDFFLHGIDSVGTLAGVPGTSQFMTSAKYLRDVQSGKQQPANALEATKNTILGPSPKKK